MSLLIVTHDTKVPYTNTSLAIVKSQRRQRLCFHVFLCDNPCYYSNDNTGFNVIKLGTVPITGVI